MKHASARYIVPHIYNMITKKIHLNKIVFEQLKIMTHSTCVFR